MKTILRDAISVLFLMAFITVCASVPASAQTGSASGTYKLVTEDGFSKSVEFSAAADQSGATTGKMTFKDEAKIVEEDLDGAGFSPDDPKTSFYLTASLNSLTVEKNRAVMGGTVTDSSNHSYIGRWVQLVVEDNGDGKDTPDKLSWCLRQPEEGGWVPSDAEVKGDEGAWWKWWATDAERKDDAGVQSTNIIPGNKTGCKVLPLSVYEFDDAKNGEGAIVVQQ